MSRKAADARGSGAGDTLCIWNERELAVKWGECMGRRAKDGAKPPTDGVVVWNNGPILTIRRVLIEGPRPFQQPADPSQRKKLETGDSCANLVFGQHFEGVVYASIHHEPVGHQNSGKPSVPFARGCTARLECRAVPDTGFEGNVHGQVVW
jgi:hypothetical protein